jgi:DNA-binding CsgD family transcriptional regulator
MLPLDNATTIILTGFIAIAFSASHLILFRKKGLSAHLWAAGSLLLGLGYILTLTNIGKTLSSTWVAGPISVLLGSLIILSSLGIWAGYKLPKKSSLICLGGVVVTASLFQFSRLFEAPLGSLEAILLAPISATLIYSGWFAGVQANKFKSKYISLISSVFWVQGVFMALLTLGALAAKGNDYIVVSSEIVYLTSMINLVATLVANIAWSIQISEDLLINGVAVKANFSNKSPVQEKLNGKNSIVNKENKPINEKTNNKKAGNNETISVNPDLLTEEEKLSLLEKLTDKERDVFFLAADGKKNGEIAMILNSSEASVKVHRSRMTGKLGMKKPEELKKLIKNSRDNLESKDQGSSLPEDADAQDLVTKT